MRILHGEIKHWISVSALDEFLNFTLRNSLRFLCNLTASLSKVSTKSWKNKVFNSWATYPEIINEFRLNFEIWCTLQGPLELLLMSETLGLSLQAQEINQMSIKCEIKTEELDLDEMTLSSCNVSNNRNFMSMETPAISSGSLESVLEGTLHAIKDQTKCEGEQHLGHVRPMACKVPKEDRSTRRMPMMTLKCPGCQQLFWRSRLGLNCLSRHIFGCHKKNWRIYMYRIRAKSPGAFKMMDHPSLP